MRRLRPSLLDAYSHVAVAVLPVLPLRPPDSAAPCQLNLRHFPWPSRRAGAAPLCRMHAARPLGELPAIVDEATCAQCHLVGVRVRVRVRVRVKGER